MRIIVLGAGEVGFHLAKRLSEEKQDVILVEADPQRAEFASQQLDVLTITGNGASLRVLEEAGVRDARMLMAVTSRDEVNLIACMAAKRLGVRYAAARISNPEYYDEGSVFSQEEIGIDLMVNPERECARETFALLRSEIATDVVSFAEGRVQLVGLKVKEGAPVVGRTMVDLARDLADHHYTTVAIVRDGRTEIPRPDSTIEAGDQLYLLSPTVEVDDIAPLAGYEHHPLRRVMIAGGSAEGEYLAEILDRHGVERTILERDRHRCLELAERLPRALILHGDATDLELLEMEGVAGIDGFVAATNNDETNLLSSLLARSAGAYKVVCLVHKFEYLPLVPRVGVSASVSPRMSTVNALLRYVRRGSVLTVAGLTGTEAEAIEYSVNADAPIAGKRLRDVHFPQNAVVGTIIRGEEIILPRGSDRILPGDDVVVFALPEAVPEVEKLFA